jgi:hypothetical protein
MDTKILPQEVSILSRVFNYITSFLGVFGLLVVTIISTNWLETTDYKPAMLTCYKGERIMLKTDEATNFTATFTTYSFDYEGKHFTVPISQCTLVE